MTDYSMLPQDKGELPRRIDHEWAALERAIEPFGSNCGDHNRLLPSVAAVTLSLKRFTHG